MTGLIGWWPLHENSGNTAHDLSGNGNHGTVNGATQGTAGKGGLTAYSFNGSGDSVDLESFNFGSIGSGNFTISLWFKSSRAGNSEYTYSVGDFSNWDDYIILRPGSTDESNPPVTFRNGSSGQAVLDPGGYADGNWHHYVVTRKGDSAEVFVDGTSKDTNTDNEIAVSPQTSNEGISPRGNFPGKISALRIYNRALSPQEIQTLYEWGSGDYASPPGTRASGQIYIPNNGISYYNFSNPNNDTSIAKDQWNSNDGTIDGATYKNDGGIRNNGAYSFDGNDYIEVPKAAFNDCISNGDSFTVSCWGTVDGQDNDYAPFVAARDDGGGTYHFGILMNPDNPNNYNLRMFVEDNQIRQSGSPYPTGTWFHTVLIYSKPDTKATLYVNGTPALKADWNLDITSTDTVRVGHDNNNKYHTGDVDEVRFYSRALEPHEVFQLYQWGTRGRDMRKLTINARGNQ